MCRDINQTLLWVLLTVIAFSWSGNVASKTFQVQVIEQPSSPNGMFTARVSAADFNDPTPNYCYQQSGCYFAGFANSKSWGEYGSDGYGTADTDMANSRRAAAYSSKTMGELATRLRDEGLLYLTMRDYLGIIKHKDPTFCTYAHRMNGSQKAGTLASNCADAPIPPASCELTPASVDFNWGEVNRSDSGYPELSRTLKVTCSRPTNIGLSVSGQSISLNGDVRTRAEFNLGSGWNGGTNLYVSDTVSIVMSSRLIGLEKASGEYTGNAVMVFEQL